MKLEDQVVNLELSKKLKELGVKQDSLWYWVDGKIMVDASENEYDFFPEATYWETPYTPCSVRGTPKDVYSAFTASELGEMLPYEIDFKGYKCILNLVRNKSGEDSWSWGCSYRGQGPYRGWQEWYYAVCQTSEAGARAKMLIHLIEEGVVKP